MAASSLALLLGATISYAGEPGQHPGKSAALSPASDQSVANRLLRAYPDQIRNIRENRIEWRDGSQSALDDGQGEKSFENWLANPDVEDMLRHDYIPGPVITPPGPKQDPGRARNTEFFIKIYGDCRKGETVPHLVDVVWLPKKSGIKLKVSRINGAAERLAAISTALDALPARYDRFLTPPAGTYNCRTIAGTDRISAHGFGIAIDIATAGSDYWRWIKPDPGGTRAWRNRIPMEIVEVFEAHGYIWGGKWGHFDTMHFEYRPELLPPSRSLSAVGADASPSKLP